MLVKTCVAINDVIMSADLCRTRRTQPGLIGEPCSRATRDRQSCAVLEHEQVSCEERGRVWAQKTHALQTTYLNPEFLHETIREKDKSATFLSTSCTELLCSPGFLLVLSWLSSAYAPSATCPWLSCHLPMCVPGHTERGRVFLGSLTQWKSMDLVGEGVPSTVCPGLFDLLCWLFLKLRCSILCTLQTGFLKGKGIECVFIY